MSFILLFKGYESDETRTTVVSQEVKCAGRKDALKRFDRLKTDDKTISVTVIHNDEVIADYQR